MVQEGRIDKMSEKFPEDKKPNSVAHFFEAPYGLDKSVIGDLPEIEHSEIKHWVGGDRFLACKLYRNRTKVKDMELIAWLFMSLNFIALNLFEQKTEMPI